MSMSNIPKILWISTRGGKNGRKTRAFLYEIYPSWRKAYNVARYFKRRNGSYYNILKIENFWGKRTYALYLTKIIRPINLI